MMIVYVTKHPGDRADVMIENATSELLHGASCIAEALPQKKALAV